MKMVGFQPPPIQHEHELKIRQKTIPSIIKLITDVWESQPINTNS